MNDCWLVTPLLQWYWGKFYLSFTPSQFPYLIFPYLNQKLLWSTMLHIIPKLFKELRTRIRKSSLHSSLLQADTETAVTSFDTLLERTSHFSSNTFPRFLSPGMVCLRLSMHPLWEGPRHVGKKGKWGWMQLENLDVPIVCIKQFELDEAEIVWDTY